MNKKSLRAQELNKLLRTETSLSSIFIVPDHQSAMYPEISVYHGPIRMNQQDAQAKILRRELMHKKRKMNGVVNPNQPRL
jgi:hypothetical protein